MVYLGYTLLLWLGGLCLLPKVLWRCLHGAAYHRDLLERFGYSDIPASVSQASSGCLWFHAASVGEVQGLQPLIQALRTRFPALPVVLSTFTPAGKTMARRVVPEAAMVFLLPFDFLGLMRRRMRHLRPCTVLVQETELWPNLYRAAAQQQVPVVIVNGRLSPRAFRRYGWIRPLIRRVLAHVTLCLAQSEASAWRFRQLGATPGRLQVAGNTNIDRVLLAAERPVGPHPLAPMLADRRVLVGGSTHEGEETVLLSVYRRLRPQYPDLLLVLAPRHLERVEAVARHVQAFHYRPVRRSHCDNLEDTDLTSISVIILDTMGELATLYRLCTMAFVGGTLVPIGGHNVLEPAVFAKPLFFGPHMHHFPELATLLCEAGGAIQVQNEEELYTHTARLLTSPQEGQAMGHRALQALMANRGALERTTEAIAVLLQNRHVG